MATLPGPMDDFQQQPINRNGALANLLYGVWKSEHISKISREPTPTNPPFSKPLLVP